MFNFGGVNYHIKNIQNIPNAGWIGGFLLAAMLPSWQLKLPGRCGRTESAARCWTLWKPVSGSFLGSWRTPTKTSLEIGSSLVVGCCSPKLDLFRPNFLHVWEISLSMSHVCRSFATVVCQRYSSDSSCAVNLAWGVKFRPFSSGMLAFSKGSRISTPEVHLFRVGTDWRYTHLHEQLRGIWQCCKWILQPHKTHEEEGTCWASVEVWVFFGVFDTRRYWWFEDFIFNEFQCFLPVLSCMTHTKTPPF